MFSFFTGSDKVEKPTTQKLRELEESILGYTELEIGKEIIRTDIMIDYLEGNNYLHTLISGLQNKDHTLVLLHGYGQSGLTFCRLFKPLSEKYKIYCPDFLGMGLSSRPKFEFKSPEQTIDYFIDSIEAWRKAIGLEKIYLGGFSLGAYFACHYALKYPENVNKLFLMGPIGLNKEIEKKSLEEMREKLGFIKRQFFDVMMKAWESKLTPQKAMKDYSIIAPFAFRKFINSSFTFAQEIKDLLSEFYLETFNLPEGAEVSIYQLITPPRGLSSIPLEDIIIEKLNIDTTVYYGDEDMTDKSGTKRILEAKKENFKVITIPKTNRHIIAENIEHLVKELLAEVRSE